MKNISRLIIIFCFFIPIILKAQSDTSKMAFMIANYPRSIFDPNNKTKENAAIYYSKDAFEKVKSFYDQIYGPANSNNCNLTQCFFEIKQMSQNGNHFGIMIKSQ